MTLTPLARDLAWPSRSRHYARTWPLSSWTMQGQPKLTWKLYSMTWGNAWSNDVNAVWNKCPSLTSGCLKSLRLDNVVNILFRPATHEVSKFHISGLLLGESTESTGRFPSQMASNAESVLMPWRHFLKGRVACGPPRLQCRIWGNA